MQTQHHPVLRASVGRSIVGCPDCGLPAEIQRQVDLASTQGLIRHAKVRCLAGHCFFMPMDDLAD